VRIYHQAVASPASVQSKQIGVNTSADANLGYKMWFGKDADGNITQFLAKDKNARMLSVRQDSSFSKVDTAWRYKGDTAYIGGLKADRFYFGTENGTKIIADTLVVKNTTNGVMLDSINGVRLIGTATCWEDVNVGAITLGAGASAPDPVNINSTGIYGKGFDGGATSEQLFGEIEVPHSFTYISTDSMYYHIHAMPTTTDTGHAVFGIDYFVAKTDTAIGAKVTVLDTLAFTGTEWETKMWISAIIPAENVTLGSQLAFRVYRLPSNAADTYGQDVVVLTIGFHFKLNMLGSKDITTK
jgi:hypothetical protein